MPTIVRAYEGRVKMLRLMAGVSIGGGIGGPASPSPDIPPTPSPDEIKSAFRSLAG